ncbi:MAG: hypothetical protein ACRC62_18500 [Microcoleus sp.]
MYLLIKFPISKQLFQESLGKYAKIGGARAIDKKNPTKTGWELIRQGASTDLFSARAALVSG